MRPKENYLVFGNPFIGQDEIDEVVATMKSGWLGTGPKVARFENCFKQYKGAKYAVAVNSCTAALHLSLIVAGVSAGDEVITTSLTFCATVNAIIHSGAIPVLADIDPISMNIDPKSVEQKISPRTRAIVPVHFAGRACDMDSLCDISRRHGLKIIEDCAHAVETEYKGRKAGTFGELACFSFYVTKNVITGEGGMLLTDDEAFFDRAKTLSLHGMSSDAWSRYADKGYKHYFVVEAGFKYNMMDIQAAIGIHQLKRVEECWRRRGEIWEQYDRAFVDLPLGLPADPEPETRHARHLYTIMIDKKNSGIDREEFLCAMNAQNIGVGVHYLSIPEHPYYSKTFGWTPEEFPHAMRIGRQTVSLPLSAKMTDGDVSDVIKAVQTILNS